MAKRFSLWPSPRRRGDVGHAIDDATLPRGLFGFVLRLSGGDQVRLIALSGLVAVLSTAPLEIQRRVVDRSLKEGSFRSLAVFVCFGETSLDGFSKGASRQTGSDVAPLDVGRTARRGSHGPTRVARPDARRAMPDMTSARAEPIFPEKMP